MVGIALIGPTGFGGSNIAIELLNRGHSVIGLSRHPEKLGQHSNYTPRALDVQIASISELVKAFEGFEVVVNAYNPAMGPNLYSKKAPNVSISTNQ
jgi:putative NADH-flavin reductase